MKRTKVSAMFADLPVALEDPVQRLGSIRGQMQELKHSGQAVAPERLTALGGFPPAMLLALGGRVASRLPQRSVNTVTTNVPGPQRPLYLTGRRMLEVFPFVPLGGSVRIGADRGRDLLLRREHHLRRHRRPRYGHRHRGALQRDRAWHR
ncbi:MAG: WS/DGAT domain-containing protein [Solirubrobacteraceae bacterium]